MVKSTAKSDKKHEFVYVIAGRDDAIVAIECEKLLDSLLEPEQRTTGLFKADADTALASDVFDELRTLPFLTEKRVVLIKDAGDFVSKNRELLEKYFGNPCPTGILILTVESWPSNTRLSKKLPSIGELISIEQPKTWELPQYLTRYAAEAHNKNLTKQTAELLIELTGDSLGRLYSEIDKLALFVGTEKVITPAHIESLTGHNRLFNAFEVIDEIVEGRVAIAVEQLRKMFAEDKSAEYTVVGAFAYHFRRMFNAKIMLEKGVSTDQIIGKLRIWRNKADSFFAQVRKMSLMQIGRVLQELAAMDYAIKTGQTKAKIAAEQLVFKLAASTTARS